MIPNIDAFPARDAAQLTQNRQVIIDRTGEATRLMRSHFNGPVPSIGRGQTLQGQAEARVLARVLKIEIRVFPSVFECSRVL